MSIDYSLMNDFKAKYKLGHWPWMITVNPDGSDNRVDGKKVYTEFW